MVLAAMREEGSRQTHLKKGVAAGLAVLVASDAHALVHQVEALPAASPAVGPKHRVRAQNVNLRQPPLPLSATVPLLAHTAALLAPPALHSR